MSAGQITATAGDTTELSVTPTGDGLHETVRIRVAPALGALPKKFVRLRLANQ